MWGGFNWFIVGTILGSSLTNNKNSHFINCTTCVMKKSGDEVDWKAFAGDCREISNDSHCVWTVAVAFSGGTLQSGWATGATQCYDSIHTSISSAKNDYRQCFCRGKIRLRDLSPACHVRSKLVLPSHLHVCGWSISGSCTHWPACKQPRDADGIR